MSAADRKALFIDFNREVFSFNSEFKKLGAAKALVIPIRPPAGIRAKKGRDQKL